MASTLVQLRDKWEHITPRERRMVVALGITFVVCIIAWLGFAAKDGMAAIEERNQEARKALRAMAKERAGRSSASARPKVEIPKKAPALDSYLESIVNDLGLESPTYPRSKRTEKGGFTEISIKVELGGLSIDELSSLLEQIETRSKVVVTKEIVIDQNFKDKETLDLEVVVATYEKEGSDDEEDDDEAEEDEG